MRSSAGRQKNFWSPGSRQKKFDSRNKAEVFFDLKKNNAKVVVDMPTFLWTDNKNIMPLSGISNSYTIFCNENGYYSNYFSDRHGFNNPDKEWDKKETEFLVDYQAKLLRETVSQVDPLVFIN